MAQKKSAQGFLKDVEKRLKVWGDKAKDMAKSLEKEAMYGGKISKLKLEEVELEARKWKLYHGLGKQAYNLIKTKKISSPLLNNSYQKIAEIDREIGKKKTLRKRYKKEFSKKLKPLKASKPYKKK